MRKKLLFPCCLLSLAVIAASACNKSEEASKDDKDESKSKKKKSSSDDDGDEVPTPKKVCAKLGELMEKEGGKPDKVEKKIKRCIEKASKTQSDEPKVYACAAKCVVNAEKMDDFKKCERKCKDEKGDKSEKKPAADDDD